MTSTSSSPFRVITPRQHDVDGFFTDQSQQKSFEQKPDDDEWDETRRWVDEIHHLNSSFTPISPQQENRNVGPVGMSRDSLNGTITEKANHFQSNDNQHEKPIPTSESDDTGKAILNEVEQATVTIQRWYRTNHQRLQQKKTEKAFRPFPC